MKLSKEQTYLLYAIAGIMVLAFATVQFGYDDLLMASFEGERSEDEVWTNLNVEYREYIEGKAMATVTADFHNNKVFEICYEEEDYCFNHNFTSFDFRFRSIEETSAYPAGIEHFSDEDVELPFGESYNVEFRIRDLVQGEPIKVELTARGYEENGKRGTLSEKLSFTLQSPVYAEPDEGMPGFTFIFAIILVFSAAYIIRKDK